MKRQLTLSYLSKRLNQKQYEAVCKLADSRGGMLWWRVGLGKTRIAIYWFLHLIQDNPTRWKAPYICLVVCRRKSFQDWHEEIYKCEPTAHVYYEHAPISPPTSEPCFLLVSDGMIAKLQVEHNILAVILDEGWLYANHKSKRSKAAQLLTESRPSILLSGTLMKAKDTLEIYNQAMAVNKHRICSPSPTKFRTEFQICQTGMGFPQWFPKKGAKEKILSRFYEVCDIHFPESEREIRDQFHTIEATPEQLRLFNQLKEYYEASTDSFEIELNNALAVIVKAQQIADGWIKDKEGNIHSIPSNKPEKLRDELESILNAGEKCVVWCAFRHDVKMLSTFLPFATVQMLGGEEFDRDRWNSSDVNVCLATEASGSAVNHFQHCKFAIYYSANFKWKDMQQSRGRTDRTSSRHSICHYKYLQVDASFDSHVYKTALDSGSVESETIAIYNDVIKWIKNK